MSVWLVTGCSSDFGEPFVNEILARGDKIIATGRNADVKLAKRVRLESSMQPNCEVKLLVHCHRPLSLPFRNFKSKCKFLCRN
jgi:hypothetical protein